MSNLFGEQRVERRDKIYINCVVCATQGGVSEEKVLQKFSTYGKILEWCFPKDRDGVRKPFGFITYSTEEEAALALREANNQELGGKTIRVHYALERQMSHYFQKSPERSVSRSPSRTQVTVESELRGKISELTRSNEEQNERSLKLLREYEDLRSRHTTVKTENDNLSRALKAKSQDECELPCGHTKKLTVGQRHLFEGLVQEVLGRLHPELRQEETLVKSLRMRTYGILEVKRAEYRCGRVLKCVLGDCGHIVTETCWQMRAMFLKKNPVQCPVPVPGPCIHLPKVECWKVGDTCRECMKTHMRV